MSNPTILKCTHANCSFETKNPNAHATHLQQSSTDGARWVCQGKGCGVMFCTAQAMNGIGGHFSTCVPFKAWNKVRKYGTSLATGSKLGLMCWRRAAQLDGREPNRPPAGFSTVKQKRKVVDEEEEGEEQEEGEEEGIDSPKKTKRKATKIKSSYTTPSALSTTKLPETIKRAPNPKRAAISKGPKDDQIQADDSDDGEDTPSKKDIIQPPKPQTARTSRSTQKYRSMRDESDEQPSSDDDNEAEYDDDFKLNKSNTQSRKRGGPPKSRANNKRRKVLPPSKTTENDEAEQNAQEERDQKLNHNNKRTTTKKGEGVVSVFDEWEQAKYTKLKHRFSATSSIEADAEPQAYGCTHCSITLPTIDDALSHAEQSNKDMRRWECMGCEKAFCDSEKDHLTAHIEACPGMKNWMKTMNISWPRRTDSDFVAMTDYSDKRRAWPARNDVQYINKDKRTTAQQAVPATFMTKYAMATKKASTAHPSSSPRTAQPDAHQAVWNGSSWYDHESDSMEHDRRRPGVLYQPGTSTTIPTTAPPAEVGDDDDDEAAKDIESDHDDEGKMFGVSDDEWAAQGEAIRQAIIESSAWDASLFW